MAQELRALTGASLEQLLDRLEADLEESGSADATDLLARLRAQPMRADSLRAIARLHSLWMRAGDPTAARAVINNDGAALLDATSPTDRAEPAMCLALYRLQIADYLGEAETSLQALEQMRMVVEQMPKLDTSAYRELPVLESVEAKGMDQALSVIELRRALDASIAERTTLRAWDKAAYHSRRAEALHRGQGKHIEEARTEAAAAFAALQAAGSDQNIDENDWLNIGDALIEIAPESIGDIRQAVSALTAQHSLPQRRETEVRLARLAARARHAQGDLVGALTACETARYHLESNGGNDFIEYELPWLLEAGRIDEAGRRAFFEIYQLETNMWEGVARIVHQRLADVGDTSVWWPLCVMRACNTHDTLECLLAGAQKEHKAIAALSPAHAALFAGLDNPDEAEVIRSVFDAARMLTEQRDPKNPWITRLGVMQNDPQGHADAAEKLAQLHAAATAGNLRDNRTAHCLLSTSIAAIGLAETLRQPAPDLPSGLWSYNFVVDNEDHIEESIEKLPADQQEEAKANWGKIKRTVYEQGIACMEKYFTEGKGHPYDACAHLYSMMCNNLGINYRNLDERYDDAISLHERGIAASPFAEHYDGILWSQIGKEDLGKTVEAAERLWQFSAEYGYGRHDPNGYFSRVASALYKLDRDNEIPIWLERLVQWQRSEGEDDAHLSDSALSGRLDIILYMDMMPEEARTLWQGIEPQVRASRNYITWCDAGTAANRRGEHELALELYRRSLELNPRETEYDHSMEQRIEGYLQKVEAELQPAPEPKSWWQFWK